MQGHKLESDGYESKKVLFVHMFKQELQESLVIRQLVVS